MRGKRRRRSALPMHCYMNVNLRSDSTLKDIAGHDSDAKRCREGDRRSPLATALQITTSQPLRNHPVPVIHRS